MSPKDFGAVVRRSRESKGIGLRTMAKAVGMSPTYLSMIERGQFPPPAEDKVVAIADAIGHDQDELLGIAGRLPSDVKLILQEDSREWSIFIRKLEAAIKKAPISWLALYALIDLLPKANSELSPEERVRAVSEWCEKNVRRT